VAPPAFAAARRAAAQLLLTAGRAAISIDIFWPPGPRQQTRSSGVRGGQMGQTDRQRDGRTPDSCIDPAPHTMRTASKNKNKLSKTFSVLARPIRYQNFNTQTNN